MKVFSSSYDLKFQIQTVRTQGQKIGFVPTMGNLHQGHLQLIRALRPLVDYVVVSIFVNPMQFAPGEDFERYPRTLLQDQTLLEQEKVDALFCPQTQEMYPFSQEDSFKIEVPFIGTRLCGGSRPGHFNGVATIVAKLFHLIQPDYAAFGKKDYQQLRIIENLVQDFFLPIKIIAVDTIREPTGLALSSRNQYLSVAEKEKAAEIFRTLKKMKSQCETLKNQVNISERYREIEEQGRIHLNNLGFLVDYCEICNRMNLQPAMIFSENKIIAIAARLGQTRLIDNIEI